MSVEIQVQENYWYIKPLRLLLSSFTLVTLMCLMGCAGEGDGLDANGQPLSLNDDPSAPEDSFAQVQDIFTSRCVECHAGSAAPAGLVLSAGQSFAALVNVTSTQIPGLNLVEPGNSEDSYLVRKIRGDTGIVGGQMPRGGPFLSTQQIDTVIAWINQGAPAPMLINPNTEFVASSGDFNNYKAWAMGESSGYHPDLGGWAHKGEDFAAIRRVYKRQPFTVPDESESGFPVGTMIVAEITQNGNITQLDAMVKRGGEFNGDNQHWEWIKLDPADASILSVGGSELRGENLMNGLCNGCHSLASSGGAENRGNDYVFYRRNDPVNDSQ